MTIPCAAYAPAKTGPLARCANPRCNNWAWEGPLCRACRQEAERRRPQPSWTRMPPVRPRRRLLPPLAPRYCFCGVELEAGQRKYCEACRRAVRMTQKTIYMRKWRRRE